MSNHLIFRRLQLEGNLIFDKKTFLSKWDLEKTFNLTLEHKCENEVLHKLSILFAVRNDKVISDSKQSDRLALALNLLHTNKQNKLWMVSESVNLFPIEKKNYIPNGYYLICLYSG